MNDDRKKTVYKYVSICRQFAATRRSRRRSKEHGLYSYESVNRVHLMVMMRLWPKKETAMSDVHSHSILSL